MSLLVALMLAGCGQTANPPSAPAREPATTPAQPAPAQAPPPPTAIEVALDIETTTAAPHPRPDGAPGAIAHVPRGFMVEPPLHLVIFLHGWSGCARALALSGEVECIAGQGSAREGWGLNAVHDAARTSSIFVVAQLAWLEREGDPGRFSDPAFVASWLDEVLAGISPRLGRSLSRSDLAPLTLVAHSAGFETMLAWLDADRDDASYAVDTVVLFDALYAQAPAFARWATDDESRRVVSVHTSNARTSRQNALLVSGLRPSVAVEVDPEDRFAALARARAVVLETNVGHSAIPIEMLDDVLLALDGTP